MSDEQVVTLRLWLLGVAEPLKFDVPLEEAQRVQQDLVQRLQAERPVGSLTMGDGTLIRYAAVAASKIVMPTQRGARAHGFS